MGKVPEPGGPDCRGQSASDYYYYYFIIIIIDIHTTKNVNTNTKRTTKRNEREIKEDKVIGHKNSKSRPVAFWTLSRRQPRA